MSCPLEIETAFITCQGSALNNLWMNIALSSGKLSYCSSFIPSKIHGASATLLLVIFRLFPWCGAWGDPGPHLPTLGVTLLSAGILEQILSWIWPIEATTLLLSSPERSESPRSATLEPSPVWVEWEELGGPQVSGSSCNPGHRLSLPCVCLVQVMYLVTWWHLRVGIHPEWVRLIVLANSLDLQFDEFALVPIQ